MDKHLNKYNSDVVDEVVEASKKEFLKQIDSYIQEINDPETNLNRKLELILAVLYKLKIFSDEALNELKSILETIINGKEVVNKEDINRNLNFYLKTNLSRFQQITADSLHVTLKDWEYLKYLIGSDLRKRIEETKDSLEATVPVSDESQLVKFKYSKNERDFMEKFIQSASHDLGVLPDILDEMVEFKYMRSDLPEVVLLSPYEKLHIFQLLMSEDPKAKLPDELKSKTYEGYSIVTLLLGIFFILISPNIEEFMVTACLLIFVLASYLTLVLLPPIKNRLLVTKYSQIINSGLNYLETANAEEDQKFQKRKNEDRITRNLEDLVIDSNPDLNNFNVDPNNLDLLEG